ncbi:hypothetical protein BJ138DRAFT_978747, partial [Hygrophoropsis aurantiaca]
VQRPFKLAVKRSQLADIVNEAVVLLQNGEEPSALRLDTTLPALRDRSLSWLVDGYCAINDPKIVKQAFALCTVDNGRFNLSFESLTSRPAIQILREVQTSNPDV